VRESSPVLRSTDRRSGIVAEAARLFEERGYHNSSMEEIAERVGLAKPSLYHYFRAKDEILLAIHNEMIELVLTRHEERVEAGIVNCGIELKEMIGDVISLMETHPGHLRIFFEHQRELPITFRAPVREKRNRFRDELGVLIRRGISLGEFRQVDVTLTTMAILGMANWTYQWLYPEGSRTSAEVTDHFWRLAMRSIAVEPVHLRTGAVSPDPPAEGVDSPPKVV
jgi:AcrR family transcriptional regulator